MLESQVGTNPRVRVQQDAAFVLWDQIDFAKDEDDNNENDESSTPPSPSPEWVRRTICCARWEAEHADNAHPRVVLATLSQSPTHATATTTSTQAQQGAVGISPVPLPLPAPPQNRHEPRASGTLVGYWARRARLAVFDVPAGGAAAAPDSAGGRAVSPEGRWAASHHHHHGRGQHRGGRGGGGGGGSGGGGGGGMVERPPAVMAMMDVVAQPSRVVRVLARGEKLDP
jgi:uncharacterized membrane protein YgcG